ncbi:2-oxo acid dehydrogenase subunit E2 [Clostridium thermarum]|uniref:2-oxo acid dehydrogenase subunit E2 n=1 Tax=Clostridium thermarum TaxID=1716543 RepID=UPI0013D1A680|nr:2-oxo acid dehydrogenase subunit E2 [Clostridium thermarum]
MNTSVPTTKRTFVRKLATGLSFRRDGRLLRNIDPMRQILPYLFRNRNGSIVHSPETIEFDNAREFIKMRTRDNPSLNIGTFEIVIAAFVRTLSQYPHLNRFVAGKKLFARNSISISFVVLRMEGGEYRETNAKVYFNKEDTLYDVAQKVNDSIKLCLSGAEKNDDKLMEIVTKLPSPIISFAVFMIRKLNDWGFLPMSFIKTDPLFSTAYISNLGSIGHDALHHHLYEWGTTSVFVTMGKLNRVNTISKNGELETKTNLNIVCSVDERVADGIYLVKALKYFKTLIKHPEKLEVPPEVVVEDDGL